MTEEMLKKLLDACFLAKKITETMPELPQGLRPRHIGILEQIAKREGGGEPVRVSDVSGDLKVTMPSITKLINELEDMKIVEKCALEADKRALSLSLTALGRQYYDIYVVRYHGRLRQALAGVDATACETTIATMEALYQSVSQIAREGTDEGAN